MFAPNPFGLFNPETVNGMPIPERDLIPNHMEAFSNGVANEIKDDANHTCRCGRSQHDGYYIDASHIDHNKKNPYYNNKENGVAECKIHHLERHLIILKEIWLGRSQINEHWANSAIRLLVGGMWYQGLNGYRPVTFEDRQEINALFEYHQIEISDYIDISKKEY